MVPTSFDQRAFERGFRRPVAAVGIEDVGRYPRRAEHTGKPPNAERRRQECVFPAVGIVGTDEKDSRVWPGRDRRATGDRRKRYGLHPRPQRELMTRRVADEQSCPADLGN